MLETNLVWLYDEVGRGPIDPLLLPSSITDLLFDPYRDLAYKMKSMEIIDSTSTNYGEFMWANFFREKIPFPSLSPMVSLVKSILHSINFSIDQPNELAGWCTVRPYDKLCFHLESLTNWTSSPDIVEQATYWATHRDSSYLPGFIGKQNTKP